MYFTFKQCAELAKVKESTARFYRDTFLGFFSAIGEGRKRQYHPSGVPPAKRGFRTLRNYDFHFMLLE